MPDSSVSRREFGLSLAALPTLASAGSLTEMSPQDDEKQQKPAQSSKDEKARPARQPEASPEGPGDPEEIPEAAWLLGLIMKRYPDERLDDAAINGILRDIRGDLRRSRTLSDFPLENSDEPGLVFRPFVGE